jgi:hypothetical protein
VSRARSASADRRRRRGSIHPAPRPPQVTRFTYTLPTDQRFTEVGGQVITISRSGSHIAYVANRRVYLKPASELEARPIAGTDAPADYRLGNIMFSYDGQSVGFWLGTDRRQRYVENGAASAAARR